MAHRVKKKSQAFRLGSSQFFSKSEVELGADLPDAGISRGAHDAHVAIEVTVRIVELRMVKHIEEFGADLKRFRLSDFGGLHQTDIEIVDSGTMEELATGISEASERVGSECVGVEEQVIAIYVYRGTGVVGDHLPHEIWLVRIRAAGQRQIVRALADCNGEPSGKANDARQVPALGKTLGGVREGPIERKQPSVAEYEVVGNVE
jgi:hypothetical protein